MRRTVAAALCLLVLVGGCGSGQKSEGTAVSSVNEATDVRTDREPIATRFPRLGAFRDVHWVGGRLGDDRVPGPSTYFIEAVVTLAPADLATITSRYPAQPEPAPPPAATALTPFVPAGPWSRSTALEQGFGPPDWVATVSLAPERGVAYVSARGQ